MVNLCFLCGKVINEMNLKFIYDSRKKTLGIKRISIVKIELELLDKQIIELHAYNELADYAFRNINKNDLITVKGKIRNNFIEVDEIEQCISISVETSTPILY